MNDSQTSQANLVPADVVELLELYQSLIAESLPDFLVGLYVVGSIALQDYIPGKSDIDFVALSPRRADSRQFQELANIHRKIACAFPRLKPSGIYVCPDDLGKTRKQIPPYPYFHKRMHKQGYFDLSELTWWQLKNRSIRIFGACPEHFDYEISTRMLKMSVTLSIQNYWKPWIKRHSAIWSPQHYALACIPRLVEWGVLSACRQFCLLNKGEVSSKTRAGLFCMEQFPKEYHTIVEDAIRIRNADDNRLFEVGWRRCQSAINYMSFVYTECERRNLLTY